jgi:hypothetical protein
VLWEEEERTDTNCRSQTSWRINSATPGGTPTGQNISGYDFCLATIGSMRQVIANNSQPDPRNPSVKEVQSSPGLVIVIFKSERGEYPTSRRHDAYASLGDFLVSAPL